MNKKHMLLFLVFMLAFSIFIPMFLQFAHENIEDYETVAVKPKKKMIFTSLNKIYTIDATNKEEWSYFSFEKGRTLKLKDTSSLSWDIAFKRTNFKSNGGDTNKKGNTGIINLKQVNINSIEEAPQSGYIEDSVFFGNISNDDLARWYKYSTQYHTVDSLGDVYVIRTAQGKYAKMKILYYYCEGGEAGCLTIEYFYQPDGSHNLKNTNDIMQKATN